MKTEEKVYDRLYKKRNNKENIFKNIDKTSKISSKSNIETSTNYLYNQFFKKNEKFKELSEYSHMFKNEKDSSTYFFSAIIE